MVRQEVVSRLTMKALEAMTDPDATAEEFLTASFSLTARMMSQVIRYSHKDDWEEHQDHLRAAIAELGLMVSGPLSYN